MAEYTDYDEKMKEVIVYALEKWVKKWNEEGRNEERFGNEREIPNEMEFNGNKYSPGELLEEARQGTDIGEKLLRQLYDCADRSTYLKSLDITYLEFIPNMIKEFEQRPIEELEKENLFRGSKDYNSKEFLKDLKNKTGKGMKAWALYFKASIKSLYLTENKVKEQV